MPKVETGDIITVSCSGVVQFFRVLEPETLTCEMFFHDSPFGKDGERAGDETYTFEDEKFGVDETRTALIKHWGKYIPSRQEVKDTQGREARKLCQSDT